MNIEKHDFYEDMISVLDTEDDVIALDTFYGVLQFNKDDVIALSRHFKLTVDDL